MTSLDVSALIDAGPDLDQVAASFVTTEYSSLTRAGAPVTFPVAPYLGAARDDGTRSLDVSTGLTYPLKAERARRDPKVTLSFSDPCGSGIDDPPIVIVKGLATVRDRDLVANSLCVVDQDIFLFEGSVRDNLTFRCHSFEARQDFARRAV